jgi:hypothetical protein
VATRQSTFTWVGPIEAPGRIAPSARDRFRSWCAAHVGQTVEITARVAKGVRSNPANAYYWAVCLDIFAEELGYEREELHAALKQRFLGLENPDAKLPRVRSTATLTPDAFWRYVEDVRRFAAEEFGLVIPDPVHASNARTR